MSELPSQKILDQEQHYLELFGLETSKIRLLRKSQEQEELDRQERQREMEEQQRLESTTKRMNSIIARASKEDKEEETQVYLCPSFEAFIHLDIANFLFFYSLPKLSPWLLQ